jgi:hypothetical protein
MPLQDYVPSQQYQEIYEGLQNYFKYMMLVALLARIANDINTHSLCHTLRCRAGIL